MLSISSPRPATKFKTWLGPRRARAVTDLMEEAVKRETVEAWSVTCYSYREGIGYGSIDARWVLIDMLMGGETYRLGMEFQGKRFGKCLGISFTVDEICCDGPALLHSLLSGLTMCGNCEARTRIERVKKAFLEERLYRNLDPLTAVIRADEVRELLENVAQVFGVDAPFDTAMSSNSKVSG